MLLFAQRVYARFRLIKPNTFRRRVFKSNSENFARIRVLMTERARRSDGVVGDLSAVVATAMGKGKGNFSSPGNKNTQTKHPPPLREKSIKVEIARAENMSKIRLF